MAFSQEQLDALEESLAEGTLIVKYADKQVTYRSLDEMLRLRNVIRQALGIGTSTTSRVNPVVNKGLE